MNGSGHFLQTGKDIALILSRVPHPKKKWPGLTRSKDEFDPCGDSVPDRVACSKLQKPPSPQAHKEATLGHLRSRRTETEMVVAAVPSPWLFPPGREGLHRQAPSPQREGSPITRAGRTGFGVR